MSAAPDKADLAASVVEDMLFRLSSLIKRESDGPDDTIKDQVELLAGSHLIDFIHQRHGARYVSRYLSALGALAEEILAVDASQETRH